MQIQKINGKQSPNFGTAVTIKTRSDLVGLRLLKLGDLLQAQAHPQFSCLHFGLMSREHDGLYKVIIGDGNHKELIHACRTMSGVGCLKSKTMKFVEETVDKEGKEPVYINKLEQILDLPMFANCRDAIAKMIASLD